MDGFGKAAWVGLAAALALAAGLRLWQLDRAALWEDDYLNLDRGLMEPARMWLVQKWQGPADTPYDFQPPLYFALLHGALSFSETSLSARAVSAAAGTVAAWGTFALGRALFGAGPGLCAALLLALSLFHIEYSRSIKAYGLFYCLSVWSAVFVHRAATLGRPRDWLAWAATALGMLYAAYIGLPAFAGQALWAGLVLAPGAWRREPGSRRQALAFAATTLAVALAYLPWLPAVFFLQRMFHDPSVNPLARIDWAFAADILAGYYRSWVAGPDWFAPAMAALVLAGAAWAARSGRLAGLGLLLLWSGLPALSVLLSKSVMNEIVSTRHLFNLLAPATLLPGAGAWALARLLPLGAGASLSVAALACLALSWPHASRLPEAYARSISLDRDFLYWLWATGRQAEALSVEGWKRRSKAFGARWYLPGMYGPPGDFARPGHRALLVVENQAAPGPWLHTEGARPVEEYAFGPFRTRVSRLDVLSRGPVPVLPDASGTWAYEDDFSTPKMLADAHAASNLAPDLTLGHLAPVLGSRPGQVVYRFLVPEGVTLGELRLELAARLYKKNPDHPADSFIHVAAGPDPHEMAPAGRIDWSSFARPGAGLALGPCKGYEEQAMYQTCARAEAVIDLSGRAGRELWVAVGFRPGVAEGFLELDSLALRARGQAPGGGPPDREWELANLLANNAVRPWKPGAATSGGLFAFAAREGLARPGTALGTPADLEAFRQERPGLEPAHVLRDSHGREEALFFDAPLELSGDRPGATLSGAWQGGVGGLVLSGRMNAPSLLVGHHRVDIPVAAPRGSVLMLNPGGRGRLVWSPDFSRGAFDRLDFSSADNLRPAPDADNDGGLTCREERPCHFMARFVSAMPMSRVRLEWYPRVVADPAGRNLVRLSYSTDDGRTFSPLESFTGSGTGKWTAMFEKHAATLSFDKPVTHFLLKAELSGEAAQLWSHARPVDRMWLEADLDARSLRPFSLPGGDAPVSLAEPQGNQVSVSFRRSPVPLFDHVKDWR